MQTENDLLKAMLGFKSAKTLEHFLRDLLTEKEIAELRGRWLAAQMLHQGHNYKVICKKTGLSSATVARVSKSLKQGWGGYRKALLPKNRATP